MTVDASKYWEMSDEKYIFELRFTFFFIVLLIYFKDIF